MLRPDAAQAIYQNGRGNGEKEYSYKLKKNKTKKPNKTTQQPNPLLLGFSWVICNNKGLGLMYFTVQNILNVSIYLVL